MVSFHLSTHQIQTSDGWVFSNFKQVKANPNRTPVPKAKMPSNRDFSLSCLLPKTSLKLALSTNRTPPAPSPLQMATHTVTRPTKQLLTHSQQSSTVSSQPAGAQTGWQPSLRLLARRSEWAGVQTSKGGWGRTEISQKNVDTSQAFIWYTHFFIIIIQGPEGPASNKSHLHSPTVLDGHWCSLLYSTDEAILVCFSSLIFEVSRVTRLGWETFHQIPGGSYIKSLHTLTKEFHLWATIGLCWLVAYCKQQAWM